MGEGDRSGAFTPDLRGEVDDWMGERRRLARSRSEGFPGKRGEIMLCRYSSSIKLLTSAGKTDRCQ